jgi:hypothetical protein
VRDHYRARLTVFVVPALENKLFRAGAPLCYLIITAGKPQKNHSHEEYRLH